MAAGLLDLKSQLVFYGSYHSNHTNVQIHKVFVPILQFTFTIMLAHTGPLFSKGATGSGATDWLEPNLALFVTLFYSAYYLVLEPVAGAAYSIIMAGFYLLATYITHHVESSMKIAIAANVVAWIAQFIGHGKYEGRAPALVDNLAQALLLAPFFVFFETAFEFGYRPELQKELKNKTGAEIARMRSAKKTK